MEDFTKESIELLKSGLSVKEVSDKTGRKYDDVWHTLYNYRDLIGEVNKFQRNFAVHEYFDNIDTENKAYLLGFFLADGSIDGSRYRSGEFSNRLMVCNSIDDMEALSLFNSEICPNSPMSHSNNQNGVGFRKEQIKVRWTSKHMTKTLIEKYNFCRMKAYNKEFLFPFETIPKDLVRHFIRGFFDGDGNVDFAKMLTFNGVETTRFQYGFVCNSYPFAKQLSDIICEIHEGVSGTIRESKGKTTNWFTLRFDTKRVNPLEKRYAFYEYFYKDSTIFLTRKKEKFDKFFEYRGKQVI